MCVCVHMCMCTYMCMPMCVETRSQAHVLFQPDPALGFFMISQWDLGLADYARLAGQ